MSGGKLIIFSAPSGSGKTTIVKHLLAKGLNLSFSISATSRSPRGNEQDGVDYYFLDKDTFRERIDKGDFLSGRSLFRSLLRHPEK